MKKTLTAAAVERIKPPATGVSEIFDAQFPGLAFRVSYGGRKAWAYYYRHGGKVHRLAVGVYPAVGLLEAREAWRKARALVQAGVDPSVQVKQAEQPSTPLFDDVLADWFKRDQGERRTAHKVKQAIDKDVTPAWTGRQIDSIGRRDVLDVIDAVADRGSPVMARRLYAYLHRFFRWSVGRGIIENNPMAHAPKPGSETKRERVLSDAELRKVWQAATKLGHPFGPIVQLLILTGARRSEIGSLQWSEIGPKEIKLAGARTKNGDPHLIPLSRPAQAIVHELPRTGDLVFSDTRSRGNPVSGWSKIKGRLDKLAVLEEPWMLHDLRRTCATGLQRQGVPIVVTEATLGHVAGSRAGVAGIYQRHDYEGEKRAALEAWGAHVMALVEGRRGRVVAMRRRAR